MFNRQPDPIAEAIDSEIARALDCLDANLGDPDAHKQLLDQVTKLHALRNKEDRVSKDTLAMIAANLAGIVMIISHERANVIASKAISFVSKLR